MIPLTNKKWRRINRYTCRGCGKTRYSFKYRRAHDGLCTKCRRDLLPEGQESLFDNDQPQS
jgi:hypothetical protein